MKKEVANPFDRLTYDNHYKNSLEYKKHYSELGALCDVWTHVASFIDPEDFVIDLGCGAGHLANVLFDKGVQDYIGIDFSEEAIKLVNSLNLSFIFLKDDIMSFSYKDFSSCKFVSTETFEHLKDDLALIKLLPRDADLFFSVPNYTYFNHYRVYPSSKFISNYYKNHLKIHSIKEFLVKKDAKIFVVNARIR